MLKRITLIGLILIQFVWSSAQVSNNDCASAQLIESGVAGLEPMYSSHFSLASSSFTGSSSCAASSNKDVWFKLIATSEIVTINVLDQASSLTIYKGNCYDLDEVGNSCLGFAHLEVGQIYLIKAQGATDNAPLKFSLTEATRSTIDNCDGATLLNPEPITNINFGNAGLSSVPTDCTGAIRDIWYYALVPTSGNIGIFVTNVQNIDVAIYNDNCSNLTEIDCASYSPSGLYIFENLTPNSTIKIRFIATNPLLSAESISLVNLPLSQSDDCSSATPIVLNSTCIDTVFASTLLQTLSQVNSCVGFPDIWFSVTAPLSGSLKIESYDGYLDISIFSGACNALVLDQCISYTSNTNIANLTGGSDYLIQISSYTLNADLKFCIYNPSTSQSNDVCNNAINLNVQSSTCATQELIDLEGASYSGETQSCFDKNKGDLWYTFTAPTSGNIQLNYIGSFSFILYSGNCGSLVEETCISGEYLSGMTPGQTYFLSVVQIGSTETLNLCLRDRALTPPANDVCSGAIALTSSFGAFTIDYKDHTLSSVNGGCSNKVHDAWYSITGISGESFILNASGDPIDYTLYEFTCGSLSELQCGNIASYNNLILENLTDGTDYKIQLYTTNHHLEDGNYSYRNTSLVNNDDCENSNSININNAICDLFNRTALNFSDATLSNVPLPICLDTNLVYRDVWHHFTAIKEGLTFNSFPYGPIESVAIYENTCAALNLVYCSSPANTFYGLTIDQDYKIRFLTTTNIDRDVCLNSVNSPTIAENTECLNATTVYVGENACGDIIEVDFTLSPQDTSSQYILDPYGLWYKFIAPPTGNVYFQAYENVSSLRLRLLESECSNLTEIYGKNIFGNESDKFPNLIPGNTYHLRIASFQPTQTLNFCLKGLSIIAPNSDCSMALIINESTDNLCNNIIAGSTKTASQSSGQFCGDDLQKAVYYQFVPSTSSGYQINISNAAANHFITLFSSCSLDTPIACSSMTVNASLTAGETYIIAVHPENQNLSSSFDLCAYPLPPTPMDNVGINLFNPQTTLDVNGGIKPGFTTNQAAGNIRWNSDLEVSTGSEWKSLIGWDHIANQEIDMNSFRIGNLNTPLTGNQAATKAYVDSHVDGDSDPNNEVETWSSLSGIPAGFLDNVDHVDDADNDPTNEIETWNTLTGIPTDFSDNVDNVDDADSDNTNEKINQFLRDGTDLTIEENGTNFTISLDTFSNVFLRDGTLLRNAESTNDDFLFGATQLPSGGSTTENLLFLDESKGAFRAGGLSNSDKWDASNLGDFSFASGFNTEASGNHSVAMGSNSIASGFSSFTTGFSNTSSGSYAASLGGSNISSGSYATSLGSQNTATKTASTAIGIQSNATGSYATSVGRNVNAEAHNVLSTGRFNIGGGNSTTWIDTDPLFEIGNGADASNLSNAFTVLKNGKVGIHTATPSSHIHIVANSTSTAGHLELTETSTGDGGRIIFNHSLEPTNRWTLYGRTSDTESLNIFNFFHNLAGNVLQIYSDKTVRVEDTLIINTASTGGHIINVGNGAHLTTGGTWTNASSRNLKENFSIVDTREILTKLASMNILTWNYKQSEEGKHIGPIAEDFYALFGLGSTETAISTVDADGVALAAIQALYMKNQELSKEIEDMKKSNKNFILKQIELTKTIEERINKLESKKD